MPTTDDVTEEACLTCGRRHGGGYNPMHPYRGPDDAPTPLNGRQNGSEGAEEAPEVTVQRFPFDPVLRQALIMKGVLSPQDLKDAEEHIRAVTAQFVEGGGS